MKKLLSVLMILIILTGCSQNKEEIKTEEVTEVSVSVEDMSLEELEELLEIAELIEFEEIVEFEELEELEELLELSELDS